MSDVNFVILRGRLTADPEMKYTTTGKAYCRFSIANNPYYQKDKQEQDVSFFNCEVWKKSAEFLSKHFSKGKQIEVEGKLYQNRYTDKDGVQRSGVIVRVNQIHFVGLNKDSGGGIPKEDADFINDDNVIPY